MNNRYFFMRHGQSEANIIKKIASSPADCINSFGLTDEGRRQALASAEEFASRDHADLIVSSDFKRAQETAIILAEKTGSDLELSPLLRERFFGIFDGQDDSNYQNVWDLDTQGGGYEDLGVETLDSVAGRIRSLIASLESRFKGKTIVLAAHGDVIQIGLCVFMKRPPREHRSLPHMHTAEIRLAAADTGA